MSTIIMGDIAEGSKWWSFADFQKRELARLYKQNNAFMQTWKFPTADVKVHAIMRNGYPVAFIYVGGSVDLIIKTADGVFKATRKKVDGVDTVVLEPFTKQVGFDFSWTNGKDLACSVDHNTVFIGTEGFLIPSELGTLYAAAATSKKSGVVALSTWPDEGYNYDVYRFSADAEDSINLELIHSATYPIINSFIFNKTTTSSVIKFTVLHDNVVLDRFTYTAQDGILVTNLYTGTQVTFIQEREYTGDNVGTTESNTVLSDGPTIVTHNGVPITASKSTTTNITTLPSHGEVITNRYTNGVFFYDINLCDTDKVTTVCATKSAEVTESMVSRQVAGGDRTIIDWSITLGNPGPGDFYYVDSSLALQYHEDNNPTWSIHGERTNTFGSSIEFGFLTDGVEGGSQLFTGVALEGGDYNWAFTGASTSTLYWGGGSGSTDTRSGAITLDAYSQISNKTAVYFSDEFVRVYREEVDTITSDRFERIGSYFNPTTVGNPKFEQVTTYNQTTIVNGIVVQEKEYRAPTTTTVVYQGGTNVYAQFRQPGEATPPPIVSEVSSYTLEPPPLGPRYAYTNNLYALYDRNGNSVDYPPKILFFPIDNGTVKAEIIFEITLPIGQSGRQMALYSGGL